jgi:hypothetical protein
MSPMLGEFINPSCTLLVTGLQRRRLDYGSGSIRGCRKPKKWSSITRITRFRYSNPRL